MINLLLFKTFLRRRPRFIPIRRGYPNVNYTNSIGGAGDDIVIIGNGKPGATGPIGPTGATGPIGATGLIGATGPSGTPGLVPVIIVNATPYNALLTDYTIEVNVAVPSSIVLPAAPVGTVFIIKDISGAAFTNPITITATTTIDGAAAATINANYGSITLIFNGIEWNIV